MKAATLDRDSAHLTLVRVTHDVVQRFANLLTEPAGEVIALPSEECLLGRTCFDGPVAGVVTVAAPVGLCRLIASSVLAEDVTEADLELRTSQAIAELANVIAGQIITALIPNHAVALSVPVTERSSYHEWVVMSCARGTVRLNVEGRPLLTSLLLLPS